VHALSKVFRAKYAEGLAVLLNDGTKLDNPPHLAEAFASANGICDWIYRHLMSTPWVVYSQPPFGGPEKVLEYLSLYTHRTAISNERIQSCVNGKVRFIWRDRRNDNELCRSVLPAMEFLRRFASHVLPAGFMRIRHFGLLANRGQSDRLNRCRDLLGQPRHEPSQPVDKQTAIEWLKSVCGLDESVCPWCQTTLHVTTIPRLASVANSSNRDLPAILDSS